MFPVMVFPYGRRRFLRNLAGRQYFVFPPHRDMRAGWGYHYEKVVIWHLKKWTPPARAARGGKLLPLPRGILMFSLKGCSKWGHLAKGRFSYWSGCQLDQGVL